MGIGRNGGIIGVVNTPAVNSASGIWTMNEVRDAVAASIWPTTDPPTYTVNNSGTPYTSGTDTNSYTFSSADLGTAETGRLVVAAGYATTTSGSDPTLSSATIAGETATIVIQEHNDSTTEGKAFIIAAVVDAGTTGDIVLNFASTMNRAGVQVYSIYGLTSTTAGATNSTTSDGGALNVNTSDDGVVIAVLGQVGGTTTTWVGVTEDYDDVALEGTVRMTGGSIQVSSASTPLSVSATVGGGSFHTGCSATWR